MGYHQLEQLALGKSTNIFLTLKAECEEVECSPQWLD